MAAALLLVLFRGNKGGDHNPKQLNSQQRGQQIGPVKGSRQDLCAGAVKIYAQNYLQAPAE